MSSTPSLLTHSPYLPLPVSTGVLPRPSVPPNEMGKIRVESELMKRKEGDTIVTHLNEVRPLTLFPYHLRLLPQGRCRSDDDYFIHPLLLGLHFLNIHLRLWWVFEPLGILRILLGDGVSRLSCCRYSPFNHMWKRRDTPVRRRFGQIIRPYRRCREWSQVIANNSS